MPGASHIFFGAVIGLFLYYLTKGRFSGKHVIIFTVNNYMGPDLAHLLKYMFNPIPGGYDFGNWFHDPFNFMLLAFVLAALWTFLTRFSIKGKGPLRTHFYFLDKRTISYFDCWQLIVAGGFSHFFLDFLFHPNTKWYTWILSTGDWIDYELHPDYPVPLMLPILGTFAIGITFLLLYMNFFSSAVRETKYDALKYKILVIIGFTLSVSIYMLCFIFFGPTHSAYPVVGEEADLGIFIFLSIFLFLPIVLCINSYAHFGSQYKFIRWLYTR
ncbi:MAG: hypothetical protein ACTSRS_08995 [Candidatus Helarchaeota archaeon]